MKRSISEKMDNTYIKDRNYRMVEHLRRENQRALRRLDEVMFSKQGVEATKKFQIDAVSKEQRMIRAELAKIRQTTATTWGILPSREGDPGEEDTGDKQPMKFTSSMPLLPFKESKRSKAKKQRLLRMKEEEGQKTAGHLKQFNDMFPSSSPAFTASSVFQNESEVHSFAQDDRMPKVRSPVSDIVPNRGSELSIADMNVTEAKDFVNRRLLGSDTSTDDAQPLPESPRHPHSLAPIDEKKILPGRKPEEVFTEQAEPKTSVKRPKLGTDPKIKATQSNGKEKPQTQTNKKDVKTKPKGKEKEAESEENELKFDSSKYNPDGSIRMMHRLPDFDESLTQALRARYVRNSFKSWYERELTVGQIFSEDKKYEPGNVKLYTVKGTNINVYKRS